MELPVPNSSMQHREPKSEIDDTGQILQGASCTIATAIRNFKGTAVYLREYSRVEYGRRYLSLVVDLGGESKI